MTIQAIIIQLLVVVFITFVCIPVHEFAHVFAANKLGDPTGKMLGRYTLNPLKHFDMIGGFMILLVGMGWGKAAPVNTRYFKNIKRDMALTAFAGPLSNIIMAFIFLVLWNFVGFFASGAVAVNFMNFLSFAAFINITLAVFNLIPIPPLDGSRILSALLPAKQYYQLMQYERYASYALIVVFLIAWNTNFIGYISGAVYGGLNWLASLPFGFR